ncbi:unnamed protein product [Ostreobium quekettii]|uniref:Uncharacterized protein n=1 Tax=Ostreobium quekettii TaxID=121088 RepID=A0A8S1JHS4_9CHLO|nr:unnamed protein product [Ostreobium quekettii]
MESSSFSFEPIVQPGAFPVGRDALSPQADGGDGGFAFSIFGKASGAGTLGPAPALRVDGGDRDPPVGVQEVEEMAIMPAGAVANPSFAPQEDKSDGQVNAVGSPKSGTMPADTNFCFQARPVAMDAAEKVVSQEVVEAEVKPAASSGGWDPVFLQANQAAADRTREAALELIRQTAATASKAAAAVEPAPAVGSKESSEAEGTQDSTAEATEEFTDSGTAEGEEEDDNRATSRDSESGARGQIDDSRETTRTPDSTDMVQKGGSRETSRTLESGEEEDIDESGGTLRTTGRIEGEVEDGRQEVSATPTPLFPVPSLLKPTFQLGFGSPVTTSPPQLTPALRRRNVLPFSFQLPSCGSPAETVEPPKGMIADKVLPAPAPAAQPMSAPMFGISTQSDLKDSSSSILGGLAKASATEVFNFGAMPGSSADPAPQVKKGDVGTASGNLFGLPPPASSSPCQSQADSAPEPFSFGGGSLGFQSQGSQSQAEANASFILTQCEEPAAVKGQTPAFGAVAPLFDAGPAAPTALGSVAPDVMDARPDNDLAGGPTSATFVFNSMTAPSSSAAPFAANASDPMATEDPEVGGQDSTSGQASAVPSLAAASGTSNATNPIPLFGQAPLFGGSQLGTSFGPAFGSTVGGFATGATGFTGFHAVPPAGSPASQPVFGTFGSAQQGTGLGTTTFAGLGASTGAVGSSSAPVFQFGNQLSNSGSQPAGIQSLQQGFVFGSSQSGGSQPLVNFSVNQGPPVFGSPSLQSRQGSSQNNPFSLGQDPDPSNGSASGARRRMRIKRSRRP